MRIKMSDTQETENLEIADEVDKEIVDKIKDEKGGVENGRIK